MQIIIANESNSVFYTSILVHPFVKVLRAIGASGIMLLELGKEIFHNWINGIYKKKKKKLHTGTKQYYLVILILIRKA